MDIEEITPKQSKAFLGKLLPHLDRNLNVESPKEPDPIFFHEELWERLMGDNNF